MPFNAATHFVDRHVAAGHGAKRAFVCVESVGESGSGVSRQGGAPPRGGEGNGPERLLTYADVLAAANRTGNALRTLGVGPDDRVLLALHDGPEFVASFWGAIKIGAIAVPVSTMMRGPDYAHFLEDSGARVAIVTEALLPDLAPALASASTLRSLVVAGETPPSDIPARLGRLRFAPWIAAASPTLDAALTEPEDDAFWLYSSGSTGAPKGVVHRQRDMVACAESYARQVLALTADDRVLSAAKLFFAYGLGNGLYFPLHVGAQAVLYAGRPLPPAVFSLIERHRPTVFFGVPTLYATMLQLAETGADYDLSSLRLCVSAGEALPAEIYQRWRARFGVEILDGIGSTEVLHIFLSNRPGRARPGSSGEPVPGYDVRIVGEDGRPVVPGEIGDLQVRGGSMMRGYWQRPEQTKAAMLGDWIRTGDKYYQDSDGAYWYCGRADDMLKVGGIWVSPIEVEAALVAHPAVLEAAVVGAQDADALVKPKAFVVLKAECSGSTDMAAVLQSFVKERIAPYKYPRWIEFVPELPKTATGKIQRFKLRA